MAFDPSARTDLVAHFDDLTSDQAEKARRVICGHEDINAEDATTIMKMLGIFPGEEEIVTESRPLSQMITPIQR